jgi:hypothetical protein
MYTFGKNTFQKKKHNWEEHVADTIFYYDELYSDKEVSIFEDSGRNLKLKLWHKTPCLLEISVDNNAFQKLYDNGIFSNTPCPKIYNIKKQQSSPLFCRGKKNIAIVTLATPNMKSMTDISFKNHAFYAKKHDYNYVSYYDSLVDFKYVTWNKVFAISDLISSFEYICWIDADAIFTNMDTTLESIIEQNPQKHLHVCDDIGGWRLNTGVMIWENCEWSTRVLKDWSEMEKIPHNQGAEQQQLINYLKKHDNDCIHWHVYNRKLFNAHPKDHTEGDFVLHMMGLSGTERIKTFTEWNKNLEVK